jgi:hypothetical protein
MADPSTVSLSEASRHVVDVLRVTGWLLWRETLDRPPESSTSETVEFYTERAWAWIDRPDQNADEYARKVAKCIVYEQLSDVMTATNIPTAYAIEILSSLERNIESNAYERQIQGLAQRMHPDEGHDGDERQSREIDVYVRQTHTLMLACSVIVKRYMESCQHAMDHGAPIFDTSAGEEDRLDDNCFITRQGVDNLMQLFEAHCDQYRRLIEPVFVMNAMASTSPRKQEEEEEEEEAKKEGRAVLIKKITSRRLLANKQLDQTQQDWILSQRKAIEDELAARKKKTLKRRVKEFGRSIVPRGRGARKLTKSYTAVIDDTPYEKGISSAASLDLATEPDAPSPPNKRKQKAKKRKDNNGKPTHPPPLLDAGPVEASSEDTTSEDTAMAKRITERVFCFMVRHFVESCWDYLQKYGYQGGILDFVVNYHLPTSSPLVEPKLRIHLVNEVTSKETRSVNWIQHELQRATESIEDLPTRIMTLRERLGLCEKTSTNSVTNAEMIAANWNETHENHAFRCVILAECLKALNKKRSMLESSRINQFRAVGTIDRDLTSLARANDEITCGYNNELEILQALHNNTETSSSPIEAAPSTPTARVIRPSVAAQAAAKRQVYAPLGDDGVRFDDYSY